ncbi:hypothetical protein CPB84DRAFT_657994 [Gymnopilus junonius]|uniref:Uncharacterized protein n=1 Tax=Gymnopilus junonius TaxID=109634 RepID=A0A9P5N9T4_GYMJU|nr:hypothetical protein CPB84DRAFT_657994 [Gymnopilus junonius]
MCCCRWLSKTREQEGRARLVKIRQLGRTRKPHFCVTQVFEDRSNYQQQQRPHRRFFDFSLRPRQANTSSNTTSQSKPTPTSASNNSNLYGKWRKKQPKTNAFIFITPPPTVTVQDWSSTPLGPDFGLCLADTNADATSTGNANANVSTPQRPPRPPSGPVPAVIVTPCTPLIPSEGESNPGGHGGLGLGLRRGDLPSALGRIKIGVGSAIIVGRGPARGQGDICPLTGLGNRVLVKAIATSALVTGGVPNTSLYPSPTTDCSMSLKQGRCSRALQLYFHLPEFKSKAQHRLHRRRLHLPFLKCSIIKMLAFLGATVPVPVTLSITISATTTVPASH